MQFSPKNIFVLFLLFYISCKKEEKYIAEPSQSNALDTITQLHTFSVTLIGMDSVECGAEILPTSQSTIYSAGLCWSKTPLPTINDSKISNTIIGGKFATIINGLYPGTIYYLRAYAKTNRGIAYGPQRVFATDTITYGKYVKGGLLFYVFAPGDPEYVEGEFHGLVTIGFLENFYRTVWSNVDTLINSSDSTTLHSRLNSSKIINVLGTGNYAARYCDSLVFNGFTDWYLPNLKEAKLMRTKVFGNIVWTSTEFDKEKAYTSTSSKRDKDRIQLKNKEFGVEAIRKF